MERLRQWWDVQGGGMRLRNGGRGEAPQGIRPRLRHLCSSIQYFHSFMYTHQHVCLADQVKSNEVCYGGCCKAPFMKVRIFCSCCTLQRGADWTSWKPYGGCSLVCVAAANNSVSDIQATVADRNTLLYGQKTRNNSFSKRLFSIQT